MRASIQSPGVSSIRADTQTRTRPTPQNAREEGTPHDDVHHQEPAGDRGGAHDSGGDALNEVAVVLEPPQPQRLARPDGIVEIGRQPHPAQAVGQEHVSRGKGGEHLTVRHEQRTVVDGVQHAYPEYQTMAQARRHPDEA
jgi:hypothetical protein